ncbi:MAG: hypothetical protein KF857_05805 [Fimbriimonadaceae bacterium]|nr:hypothetical protein [Fimbriimonadaceae bacterium]
MGTLVAAADIGSNTAHLLVADVTPTGLRRIVNESEWLSLGEVVKREGHIPKKDADRLIATLRAFKETANNYRVKVFYVFATEAMRRAANHDSLLAAIKTKLGIEVDVVSPSREAELSLRGASVDSPVDGHVVLVETGGGSVQVADCRDGKIVAEKSLPIGTGTLIAASQIGQPADPAHIGRVKELVADALREVTDFARPDRIVACGGVARGVWRALHPDGHPELDAEEIRYLAWDTARLATATISARYSVKLKRAQTLLPGSLVYLGVLDTFGQTKMYVSEYGVREGAVLELADDQEGRWRKR